MGFDEIFQKDTLKNAQLPKISILLQGCTLRLS